MVLITTLAAALPLGAAPPAIALPAPALLAPKGGKAYPAHWGEPPRIQTRDLRPLPGGYGQGSGTLARWIQENLDADAKDPNRGKNAPAAITDAAKVKAAMEAWAKAKEACGGNYSYSAGFQSAFGFGHTTTIVVAGNKVVERRFEEFNRNAPPPPPGLNQGAAPPNGYLEKGAAVGKNPKGAPALTLDQVYADAAKIAAKQLPENESRYVRVNKDGLLLSCFTKDKRILDDAPLNGIHIDAITLAPAKKAEGKPDAETVQADLAPKVHSGHFVSNQYRPQEVLTLAVFTTLAEFNKAFGSGAFGFRPGRTQFDYVDAASFANGRVVAVLIRRDHTPHKYTLDKASLTAEGELLLQLRSEGQPSPDATFASPLVVSLAPAGAKAVRFVENGAQVGKVAVPKLEAAPQVIEAANPGKGPARKPFPAHWGEPPRIQTRDLRPLPGGYGQGSGTLANWIQQNLDADAKDPDRAKKAPNVEPPTKAKGKGPARKPFPAHWGLPPRIQTSDFGPLPGGYGSGSSTLKNWIQKNLDADAKDPNRGKEEPQKNPKAEIERVQKRIAEIEDLMKRARFTKEGFEKISAELKELKALLNKLQSTKEGAPANPATPEPPKAGGEAGETDVQAEIAAIEKRIVAIHSLKQIARLTPQGLAKIDAELATLQARLKQLHPADAPGAQPKLDRPPVSAAFAKLHPAGSYAPGELLVGMNPDVVKADREKALAQALPGLTVVTTLVNDTIFHVRLPADTNVEQAMARLKAVPSVRYSELNQIVSIPAPVRER